MAAQPLTMESESDHFSPYRADGKLYGFVCVVTGADQPVGAAIVTELAAHGAASIYACTSSSTSTPDLPKDHSTTTIISYPYSPSSDHDTLLLIDEALNTYGRLDIWICASTLLGPTSISTTTPADLHASFEANALAPFFALKYGPPAMTKTTSKGTYSNAAPKDQAYGSIVVVSSKGGGGPSYAMSSAAALGVVKAGVPVLKGSGVRINAISVGEIDVGAEPNGTNTVKMKNGTARSTEAQKRNIGLERAGLPMEVGRVAGFLASGFSSYITGANLVVDGGASAMSPLTVPI